MASEILKIGLAGFGRWGQEYAQRLPQLDGVAFEPILGTTSLADLSNFLDPSRLDVVAIVLPNHLHVPATKMALDRGIHVLCEKPLFTDLEELETLRAARKNSRAKFVPMLRYRHSHTWGVVGHALAEGLIGKIECVRITLSRKPFLRGVEDWRYDAKRVKSWVLEEGIHFLDLIFWYVGQKLRPEISAVGVPDHSGLHAHFSVQLSWPGCYAVYSQNTSAFEHLKILEVVGSGGTLRYYWNWRDDRVVDDLQISGKDGQQLELSGWRADYSPDQDLLARQLRLALEEIHGSRSPMDFESTVMAHECGIEIERQLGRNGKYK